MPTATPPAPKVADPLAAALDSLPLAENRGGATHKIDDYFGERPDVLEAIKRARRDNRHGYQKIADMLSTEGRTLSDKAVKGWLKTQGID